MDAKELKSTIAYLIRCAQSFHPNYDFGHTTFFNMTTLLLAQNIDTSIACLNEMDEEMIDWISVCFSQLMNFHLNKTNSRKFLLCLNNIEKKYPNNHFQSMIDRAKNSYRF
jgi:hypothetical protein